MPAEGYETIEHLLAGRGYERINTFSFRKIVVVDDKSFAVDVDFLAGEYQGTGRGRRHQRVQNIQARKARGCDLAFDRPVECMVEGELPGGGP